MKKKLYDLLKLNNKTIFKELIINGLFCDKLPPIFTGSNFYEFLNIDSQKELLLEKNNFCTKGKDYVKYEYVKHYNVPRLFGIPNPVCYARLCNILSTHWNEIKNFFQVDNNVSNENMEDMEYEDFFYIKIKDNDVSNIKTAKTIPKSDIDLMVGKKFLVITDIANFFPSIYTHSIPWVIEGKENIKKELFDKKVKVNRRNKWLDELDKALRNLKFGETNGLLVGPLTSNIVAEILLTKIDEVLNENNFSFVRYVDDYRCYTKSFEEAEIFLLVLSQKLKEYGLTLNLNKTKILELPQLLDNWTYKLNQHYIVNSNCLNLSQIKSFWDFVIDLFLKNNKNLAILNYAIQILSDKDFDISAFYYHFKMVSHLVILYPYLVNLLEKIIFGKEKANKQLLLMNSIKKIKGIETYGMDNLLSDIFNNGNKKKRFESMSFALYYSIKYNVPLGSNIHKEIYKITKESSDTVLMIMSYLYCLKNGLTEQAKQFKELAKRLIKEEKIDKHWLFVYETLSTEDLKEEYALLKEYNVSFIKKDFFDFQP